MEGFSPQENRAINYYLKGCTMKDALKKAGYAESTQRSGSAFFERPKIKEEVERRQRGMVERNEVTEDMIVQKLAELAFTNLGDGLVFSEDGDVDWDLDKFRNIPALRGILANIKVERYTEGRGPNAKPFRRVQFSSKDQLKALELLMKYLGMFEDKVNVKVESELADRLTAGRERVWQ